MLRSSFGIGITALSLAWVLGAASAEAQESAYLRTSCTGMGSNCFTTVAALDSWIWNTRQPSSSAPLVVEIGVGSFSGNLTCPTGEGHVTYRGVGRDRSILTASSGLVYAADGCEALGFQDLSMRSDVGIAVTWQNGGSSSWTDVDLRGVFTPFYNEGCSGAGSDPPTGEHFFWGVKFDSRSTGLYAECGDLWLYGSDVFVRPEMGDLAYFNVYVGVWSAFRSSVRVFGSTIRVTNAATNTAAPLIGVRVGDSQDFFQADGYGEFHMHGGIINVDALGIAGVDAQAIEVDDNGVGDASAHAPGTAFTMRAGTGGKVVRAAGSGTLRTPYLWEAGNRTPLALVSPTFESSDGADLFVETDCGAGDPCDGTTSSAEPHLMIYWSACGAANPWWDTVENACRDAGTE